MATKELVLPTIESLVETLIVGSMFSVWGYAGKIAVEFGTKKSYGMSVYEDSHIRIETDYHTRIWVKLADVYVVDGNAETLVFEADYKSGEWTSNYIDVTTFRTGAWINHVMELGRNAQAEIDLLKWSDETKEKLSFKPINDHELFDTEPLSLSDTTPKIKPATLAEQLELLIRRIIRDELREL